jgi:hypothetical protein
MSRCGVEEGRGRDGTFPHNSTTRSAQKISPEEKKQNKLINGARKLLAF